MPLAALVFLAFAVGAFLAGLEMLAEHFDSTMKVMFFRVLGLSALLFVGAAVFGYIDTRDDLRRQAHRAAVQADEASRNAAEARAEQETARAWSEARSRIDRRQGFFAVRYQGAIWEFQLVRQPDQRIRVYPLAHPSYGRRKKDLHETHRHYDSARQQHYLCLDPEPKTVTDAIEFIQMWCEHTHQYIQTGTSDYL